MKPGDSVIINATGLDDEITAVSDDGLQVKTRFASPAAWTSADAVTLHASLDQKAVQAEYKRTYGEDETP